MHESELLAHIYSRSSDLSRRFPHIIAGPGHDCAVVRIDSKNVLLKVDQLVGGRHFQTGLPFDLIARKAIARAVSDIAASGGTPLCALAGATLPPGYSSSNELFDAMSRWAIHFGCPLVGGDIATGGDALILSVTVVGRPHPTRGPVLRSGAAAGDGVYVTGCLGGSFDPTTGRGHHVMFEPRLRESGFLCDVLGPRLHAMMDLSDGLGRDAGRLAHASRISIEVEEARLPMTAGIADWRRAVGDGEDYELLFAAAGDVPTTCPGTGTPITRIGAINAGPPAATILLRTGERQDISNLGWEHKA